MAQLSPKHGAGAALIAIPEGEIMQEAPVKSASIEDEYIKLSIEIEAPVQNVYIALSEVSCTLMRVA
jgi:hypothetical protein